MDAIVAMSQARRRDLCNEAGHLLGLSGGSVEKDFWVCWLLRRLFALPALGSHLTFKGGTSLSKGWKLIQRFSEDLDVVIDRHIWGFTGAAAPETAPSQKQRAKRLDLLLVASQRYVRDVIAPELERDLHASPLLPGTWRLVLDADDPDAQTLLFEYPAAAAAQDDIRPIVKIELGARSDTEPCAAPSITPYLAEALPGICGDCAFTVRAVAPERTFWEKLALLHEEAHRVGDAPPKARLARHYYDVWALIRAGVEERATAAPSLFARVAAHRVVFFRKSREAQASLQPGALRVLPTGARRSAWNRDYEAMRESMFYGETPSFAEILDVVGEFERVFNASAESRHGRGTR